jgi:S-DNA-T family DNA segregation ATPase FtsK/SpoIIIE
LQSDTSNSTSPFPNWVLPSIQEILDQGSAPQVDEALIMRRARLIEGTLASLGAPVQVVEISRGPTFTQFGVEPLFIKTKRGRTRVPVSKITSLAEHLPLDLSEQYLYIQFPVPGSTFVGIAIPNRIRTLVTLREILESDFFLKETSPLRFVLGRDVAGIPMLPNLAKMPHLLITGATGSGKSVCVHAILTSLLLQNTPDYLRLVLVDTKRVELSSYNGIPHLLAPVIMEADRAVGALQWLAREMDQRYHAFAKIGVRKIGDYNTCIEAQGGKKLPFLLIIIDELANLMNIEPTEIEGAIKHLALGARATGIHFIITTLQLSKDVLPDSIKDNFPARATFDVTSKADSIFLLGQAGAERLLGRGDMLFKASCRYSRSGTRGHGFR